MKKNIFLLLADCSIAFTFLFAGCKKAENIKTTTVKPEISIDAALARNINNLHLYKDTVYNITGQLERQAGQELIIDAGTLIKMQGSAAAIYIAPGGSLKASGTRNNPVVFTSGAYMGTQFYNWAGITVQGNAKNNARALNAAIDTTDFSCTLTYVRIEFASLTLDAAGSRSIVENVMVSYTNQLQSGSLISSAFNFYGGSVNCRNLVSYACGGPADFYITNGYNGKMQNILAYRHPYFGNSANNPSNALAGVYIKNNRNDNNIVKPFTNPVISNLTVLGPNAQNGSAIKYSDTSLNNAAVVTTGNAFFKIRNAVLLGFPAGGLYVNDSLTTLNLINNNAELKNSFLHSNDSTRVFYLNPRIYRPYTSSDLKVFMLQAAFKNKVIATAPGFNFLDPFNYNSPNILPADNSPVLIAGDFNDVFSDAFFIKVNYAGALGKENWLEGWVNFTPLKTNYNFPE
jgi:hypothetical protein